MVVGQGLFLGIASTEGVGERRLYEGPDSIQFLPRCEMGGADGVEVEDELWDDPVEVVDVVY